MIQEEFRIFISILFHSDITVGKKGIFEKIMSDLKIRDFVAVRTSCSIDVIVWWN